MPRIMESISPQPVSSGYTHGPAANTAAVVTLAAPGAGRLHAISGVMWSYDGDPTGGALTITDGGTTVFQVNVTVGGPGFFVWFPPLQFANNAEVVITLAAGGAGISGKVNAHTWVG